jgi:predicted dehydrogenase
MTASATPASVRLGIIGVGGMGSGHLGNILAGKIHRLQITALCDLEPGKYQRYPQFQGFTDSRALIRSGLVDAVLIATPHYFHTTIGIDALEQGLHVLTEKPISVHKADCERLIAAYQRRPRPEQVFAAMFNERTDPHNGKLRELITSGELGEIRRINYLTTDWFRSEAYYASGGWRATWKGEGGGVLTNQCPHRLDLMQWFFGMPAKIRAFCGFGRWHRNIEVEDQVTAYLEYPNGATGVFVTTTGEAPGTNRMEIAAENGRVVMENGRINFTRNLVGTTEFSRTTREAFARPETWNIEIPVNGWGGQHVEVLQNFVDAILDGKPLIAPASEGINSVELANAFIYSSLTDATVALPLDGAAYEKLLMRLIAESKLVKKESGSKLPGADDFAKSFGR